jgi:hypothetical protein
MLTAVRPPSLVNGSLLLLLLQQANSRQLLAFGDSVEWIQLFFNPPFSVVAHVGEKYLPRRKQRQQLRRQAFVIFDRREASIVFETIGLSQRVINESTAWNIDFSTTQRQSLSVAVEPREGAACCCPLHLGLNITMLVNAADAGNASSDTVMALSQRRSRAEVQWCD